MKEKFIKSTIILVIGGLITKILGMFIRIIMTRLVGLEGIGLYMIILPTFNLFITIATLSFPVAISKVVAENVSNNKKLIFSLVPLSLIINVLLLIIILLLAPYLSSNLLKDEQLLYPIISIGFVLPFISISSIARGYFLGKERMFPQVISNIFEQIIRLICLILIVPKLVNSNLVLAISSLVLINIVSELASIIILFIFLPKSFKLTKDDFKLDKLLIKNVLNTSIPTTFGRLAGSIGYFFEPIVITQILLFIGYSNNYIVSEYGIISGYVMPLLLMPSFLTMAISSALLPAVSKSYITDSKKSVLSKIKKACLLSLFLGIIATLIMFIFPKELLKLIYDTYEGSTYLKILAPFFLIYYIQAPLASALQAINKSKKMMIANLLGIIIKTIILAGLLFLKLGMYPLIIANAFNVTFVTILHYIDLKKWAKT